jgi:3',5'-cyclic AMP phosphodiesterase CpdA
VLEDAKLPDGSVTLGPGNHDAYTRPDGWKRALAGPLRRFAAASAEAPGKVVERGDVVFLPIDTSCFQSIAWAGGEFSKAAAEAVEARIVDPAFRDKAMVLVLHHSPIASRAPLMQWIDGLRGCARVLDLLAKHPRLQVLHGHLHKVVDRILAASSNLRGAPRTVALTEAGQSAGPARVFGAPAICEDREDTLPRVRLYAHAGGGRDGRRRRHGETGEITTTGYAGYLESSGLYAA